MSRIVGCLWYMVGTVLYGARGDKAGGAVCSGIPRDKKGGGELLSHHHRGGPSPAPPGVLERPCGGSVLGGGAREDPPHAYCQRAVLEAMLRDEGPHPFQFPRIEEGGAAGQQCLAEGGRKWA